MKSRSSESKGEEIHCSSGSWWPPPCWPLGGQALSPPWLHPLSSSAHLFSSNLRVKEQDWGNLSITWRVGEEEKKEAQLGGGPEGQEMGETETGIWGVLATAAQKLDGAQTRSTCSLPCPQLRGEAPPMNRIFVSAFREHRVWSGHNKKIVHHNGMWWHRDLGFIEGRYPWGRSEGSHCQAGDLRSV